MLPFTFTRVAAVVHPITEVSKKKKNEHTTTSPEINTVHIVLVHITYRSGLPLEESTMIGLQE